MTVNSININDNKTPYDNAKRIADDKNTAVKPALKWAVFIAAILFPTVYMLLSYNLNDEYVHLGYFLLVCLGMSLFTGIVYLITYPVFRYPLSSFVFCSLQWVLQFTLASLLASSYNFMLSYILWTVAGFFISMAIGLLIKNRDKIGIVSVFICVFVGILFVFNAVNIVRSATYYNDSNKDYIKQSFAIDETKENPNIYWIHCDGMLSFDAVEKYFGNSQEAFIKELNDKGFTINEDAMFEAGRRTKAAIPTLMSPYFYDSYLAPLLTDHDKALNRIENQSVLYTLAEARINNELIAAFSAKGYTTNSIGPLIQYFYTPADTLYYSGNGRSMSLDKGTTYESMHAMNINGLSDFIMKKYKILGIILDKYLFSDQIMRYWSEDGVVLENSLSEEEIKNILYENDGFREYEYMIQALERTFNEKEPKLTIVYDVMPHFPFIYDEMGNQINDRENMSVKDYHAQHVYSSKVLSNIVDMIIKRDKSAIIILQGDHGLHCNTESDFKEIFGDEYSTEELYNKVISAVRIPEKYRTGEEAATMSDPRNISRYLVNNFVGYNYEYIIDN